MLFMAIAVITHSRRHLTSCGVATVNALPLVPRPSSHSSPSQVLLLSVRYCCNWTTTTNRAVKLCNGQLFYAGRQPPLLFLGRKSGLITHIQTHIYILGIFVVIINYLICIINNRVKVYPAAIIDRSIVTFVAEPICSVHCRALNTLFRNGRRQSIFNANVLPPQL